ncbi:MAG: hypothetical protein QOH39_3372 [Verrucomicrobiota bacterium]|jgi:hypothetical protein
MIILEASLTLEGLPMIFGEAPKIFLELPKIIGAPSLILGKATMIIGRFPKIREDSSQIFLKGTL